MFGYSRHITPAAFFRKHRIKFGLLFLVMLFWWFSLPAELFTDPYSTVVESREGDLLGARIADDGQWRFPPVDSIPERFEQSVLLYEDEHFYRHPGFNPVSMAKAFWSNLTSEKRRGGSTITQQVVRLSRKNRDRTYFEKLIEVFIATRLEARNSKKEILNLYASHAPFGGNVVGIEAASWRYFGLPASELSWGQTASLAVLPNAPSLIFPGKNDSLLKRKRDALLFKLKEKGVIDATVYELSLMEELPGKPVTLPQLAPHFTEKIRSEHPGLKVRSTLDTYLQQHVNRIVAENHSLLLQNQIHNLAVLVMDVESREVLVYIGNSPTSLDNKRHVDIIDKRRSTGSILKPFLFASALQEGLVLPNSLIADVPTVVNGYVPENFDRSFNGAIPAGKALSRSLNVPSVRLLRKYGLHKFHQRLQQINLNKVDRPADHYGLSLILGGAESSLWEITAAYAAMASTLNHFNRSSSEYRSAEFTEPVLLTGTQENFGKLQSKPEVFDAGAIYHTLNTLQFVNRPNGQENWNFFSNSQPIAWKTGTSYGFKDAWAVGVTPQYAIGVWVGNADGEGRPGLTGLQAAAPVLFDVLDLLPSGPWFDVPFDELREADICVQSGHLAGPNCDETALNWIPKSGLRSTACPYHKQVFLSRAGNYRVNSSCEELAEMRPKSWFVLPPIMEYYYAPLHPEYNVLPPYGNGCLKDGEDLMEFVFPKRNETVLLARNFDSEVQDVILKLAHRNPESKAYWYLDDNYVGSTETFHELPVKPEPGSYELTVVDQEGNEINQLIHIQLASEK